MSKIKVIAILAVLVLCMGVFAVQAETQPVQTPVTNPVATSPVQTQPDITEPVESQPVGTNPTSPANPTGPTQSASGVDGTTPSGATQPSSAAVTEPTTEFVRPTELVTEPSTYSDYVSPAPIYTPGNQDFQKNEWENIELDLSDEKKPGGTGGSFLNIKNNNSAEDQQNPLFLILAIVFWFIALSAITFLLLYRPEKKAAFAKAGFDKKQKKNHTEKSPKYERKYSDDYNDGF